MSDYKAETHAVDRELPLEQILGNFYSDMGNLFVHPDDAYIKATKAIAVLIQSETTKARLAGAIDELQNALYYTDAVWVKRDKVDSHEQIIHANRIKDRIAQLQTEEAKHD